MRVDTEGPKAKGPFVLPDNFSRKTLKTAEPKPIDLRIFLLCDESFFSGFDDDVRFRKNYSCNSFEGI